MAVHAARVHEDRVRCQECVASFGLGSHGGDIDRILIICYNYHQFILIHVSASSYLSPFSLNHASGMLQEKNSRHPAESLATARGRDWCRKSPGLQTLV